MEECRNGHTIRGSFDRIASNGNCRQCDRDAGARYRARRRRALASFRAMQAVA